MYDIQNPFSLLVPLLAQKLPMGYIYILHITKHFASVARLESMTKRFSSSTPLIYLMENMFVLS